MKKEEAIRISDQALEELAASLRAGKSDMLIRYLESVSQFHQYSFSNCMLIYAQRPSATRVAGFSQWKKLGRNVKKGEKGIGIIAPMIGKAKEQDETSEESPRLFGFRVVHVFDVEQTDGDPLPDLDLAVQGDVDAQLTHLETIVRTMDIELSYVEDGLGSALGVSKGGRIEILSSLTSAERFSVLAHELAHEMLHRGDRRHSVSKVVRELEAEAVAFVVCSSQGLECGTTSSDYIQLYSGDESLLMESLEEIRAAAANIIGRLAEQADAKEVLDVA